MGYERVVDIYLVQHQASGKQYIGRAITSKQPGDGTARRWREHCRSQDVTYLHKAIRKYGKDQFSVSTLLSVEDKKAGEYEQMFIELYDCQMPKGYNMTRGGEGCSRPMDPHSIEKMYNTRWPDRELPMNITHRIVDNNEGYVVSKQGYGDSRAFMSMKLTMQEKLQLAQEYLATLTERRPKTKRDLPKHVTRERGNLKIEIKRRKKVVFWKSFIHGSDDEKLANAQRCLEQLRTDGLIR